MKNLQPVRRGGVVEDQILLGGLKSQVGFMKKSATSERMRDWTSQATTNQENAELEVVRLTRDR